MGERELQNDEEKTAERFANRSENFFKAYEAWEKEQLCSEKRDDLRKALHSMRKVLARVEIEMALSESKERAKNPMPIPTHRTQNKKKAGKPLEVSDEVKTRIKARKKAEAEAEEKDFNEKDDLPEFLTQENGGGDDNNKPKPRKPRSSQRNPRGSGSRNNKKKED